MSLARCIASQSRRCCARTVSVCTQQPAFPVRLSGKPLVIAQGPLLANVAGSNHASARQYCDVRKPDKKVEFVLLVSSDDKVLGTKTKDEALAFAKKHDYHLVRLEEDKHAEAKKRKVYKLVSSQQMLDREEELAVPGEATRENAPKQQHTVKNVIASSKITDNDLTTKLKSVKKWLDKKCEIRVGITGTPDSTKQLDAIYEKFEAFLGSEARFLQKRINNGVLKFVILPPSEKKTKTPQPASKRPATEEG